MLYRTCTFYEGYWNENHPYGENEYTGAWVMGELRTVVFDGNAGQVNYTTPLISDFEHHNGVIYTSDGTWQGEIHGEEWETAFRSVLCDC